MTEQEVPPSRAPETTEDEEAEPETPPDVSTDEPEE